jgi:hypothetical protein
LDPKITYDGEVSRDQFISEELIVNHKITILPCGWFYGANQEKIPGDLMRVCFCKSDDVLEKLESALRNVALEQQARKIAVPN